MFGFFSEKYKIPFSICVCWQQAFSKNITGPAFNNAFSSDTILLTSSTIAYVFSIIFL